MSLFLADSITLRLDSSRATGDVVISLSRDLLCSATLTLELVVSESFKLPEKPLVTQNRASFLPRSHATLVHYPDGIKHGVYTIPFTLEIPLDFPRCAEIQELKLSVSVSKKLIARLSEGTRHILQQELKLPDPPEELSTIAEHRQDFTQTLIPKSETRCCCIVLQDEQGVSSHIVLSTEKSSVRPGDKVTVLLAVYTENFCSGTIRLIRIVEMKDSKSHTDLHVIYWLPVLLSRAGGSQRASVDLYIPLNVDYVQTNGALVTVKYAVEFAIVAQKFKSCSVRAPLFVSNR
jgi:hypothetical protein